MTQDSDHMRYVRKQLCSTAVLKFLIHLQGEVSYVRVKEDSGDGKSV